MATLRFTPTPSFILTRQKLPTELSSFELNQNAGRSLKIIVWSYKVVIEDEGQYTELRVEPDETILSGSGFLPVSSIFLIKFMEQRRKEIVFFFEGFSFN